MGAKQVNQQAIRGEKMGHSKEFDGVELKIEVLPCGAVIGLHRTVVDSNPTICMYAVEQRNRRISLLSVVTKASLVAVGGVLRWKPAQVALAPPSYTVELEPIVLQIVGRATDLARELDQEYPPGSVLSGHRKPSIPEYRLN